MTWLSEQQKAAFRILLPFRIFQHPVYLPVFAPRIASYHFFFLFSSLSFKLLQFEVRADEVWHRKVDRSGNMTKENASWIANREIEKKKNDRKNWDWGKGVGRGWDERGQTVSVFGILEARSPGWGLQSEEKQLYLKTLCTNWFIGY
jgi:hypothetical protein